MEEQKEGRRDERPVEVFTLGLANQPWDRVRERLSAVSVDKVIDVRSRPFARYAPQFDREELEGGLADAGIEYEWLGRHLGQRPDGAEFYDAAGHTLYDRVAAQPWFMKAIGRVEYEAERRTLVLICQEEEPERCHRWALIGKVLADRGVRILHLRKDGTIEEQARVDERSGVGQQSLLSEPGSWRSPEPMR